MLRNKRLVIVLYPEERKAIEDLAKARRLPPSTMARVLLLNEAAKLAKLGDSQEVARA